MTPLKLSSGGKAAGPHESMGYEVEVPGPVFTGIGISRKSAGSSEACLRALFLPTKQSRDH